jgi:hypothetical protein
MENGSPKACTHDKIDLNESADNGVFIIPINFSLEMLHYNLFKQKKNSQDTVCLFFKLQLK